MSRMKGPSSILLLAGGCLLGASALFLIALLLSGSVNTATVFSVVPVGFFVPVAVVFALASARPVQTDDCATEAPRPRDTAIAVGYTASVIPYWFCSISAINGRVGLASVLFLAYAAMAALPLRSMLRVRKSIEGGMKLRQE